MISMIPLSSKSPITVALFGQTAAALAAGRINHDPALLDVNVSCMIRTGFDTQFTFRADRMAHTRCRLTKSITSVDRSFLFVLKTEAINTEMAKLLILYM